MIGTFLQPNFETQTGTLYKQSLDNSIAVMARLAAAFAPHEQDTPNMTVRVNAGDLWVQNALVQKAAQNSATITAPTGTDHRIDRIVIDAITGAVSVITGTPGASPTVPTITTGKLPICQVSLAHGMTVITNALITDERVGGAGGGEVYKVGDLYSTLTDYANSAAVAAALGYGTWGKFSSLVYASRYPPAQSDTYVKATTSYELGTAMPYMATDPTKSLIGSWEGVSWFSHSGAYGVNQRFHIDLGSAKNLGRIYYENYHTTGTQTSAGAKNFTLWGSDNATAFAELTYATDTNWTQIGGSFQFDQHTASNVADPKYITVSPTSTYRYYAFKIADNWGGGYMGIRRLVLESALVIQSYSEATIKVEGSYSLKGVAVITGSLNKTLTRTVSPTINLTDKTIIEFYIRASRTGSNIKIGIHDSGGTTTEITPNILTADTWQRVIWDISAVSNANKDAIDSIIVTIANADAANTFYLDNLLGDVITNYLIHRGRDRMRTAGYSLG